MRIAPILLLIGCFRPPPEADAQTSDALRGLFQAFDQDDAALAAAARRAEADVYASLDAEARDSLDRSVAPEPLTLDDVAHLEHPDRDPALVNPVAVVGASPFEIRHHRHVQLLADHTPVEPYSPDTYDRTFLGGEGCWLERGCGELLTLNDLVKETGGVVIPYSFYKDFRWVDLAEDGDPRWAYVGRSWSPESYYGENPENAFLQTYTIELWAPRDGRGPRDAEDTPWTADSSGGGTLRVLVVWSETVLALGLSEEQMAGTTRYGIDRTFRATDAWLEEHAAELDP